MLNFDFHNPTHIVFGKGRVADLAKLVPAAAKVMGVEIKKEGEAR